MDTLVQFCSDQFSIALYMSMVQVNHFLFTQNTKDREGTGSVGDYFLTCVILYQPFIMLYLKRVLLYSFLLVTRGPP